MQRKRQFFSFLPGILLCLGWLLPAQAGSVVTLDANNILSVNGQKTFTLGFSPGPPTGGVTSTGKDALQELRDAGGRLFRMNQTANWSSQVIADQQAALDWAAQHDMYCWVNLRELSQFTTGDTNTAVALANIVDTFKDHPAVGFWKNSDEAWWSGVSDQNLLNGYNVIKLHDTNHPVVQTHAPRGTVSDLQPYDNALDIAALDLYPVGYPPGNNSLLTNKEISMIGDWTQILTNAAAGQHQCWMIEQIAWSGVTPPAKTLRFPTFSQERYMAYQAIINGAGGLLFFGGNVTATLNPQDAVFGWNWTFWDTVLKRLVLELGDKGLLSEALVATNSTRPITMTGAAMGDLEYCVREVPPYLYIFASKREGSTVQVTFNGLPASTSHGDLLYEDPRSVTATNGQFTDWFDPFEVHVYRFNLSNSPPVISSQPQNVVASVGATGAFSVAASGGSPLNYRWQKNGLELSDGGNISGASSSTLNLYTLQTGDIGSYSVMITNAVGSILSSVASLNVISPIGLVSPTFAGGHFQFDYTNDAASGLQVYASTNLTVWSLLGPATQVTPGHFKFSDTNPPGSFRFYRLHSP